MENWKQGNILIADWLEAERRPYSNNKSYDKVFTSYSECEKYIIENHLVGYTPHFSWKNEFGNYRTSWDWLMPVFDKIDAIDDGKYMAVITNNSTSIRLTGAGKLKIVAIGIGETRIGSAYDAVIDFIHFYQSTSK